MALDKFGVKQSKRSKKVVEGEPPKKTTKKSRAKKTSEKQSSGKTSEDIVDDFDRHNAGISPSTTQIEEEEQSELKTEPRSGISPLVSSKKKNLKCTNGKCGYKRTLFKKELTPEDYICGKCGGQMKLVK